LRQFKQDNREKETLTYLAVEERVAEKRAREGLRKATLIA